MNLNVSYPPPDMAQLSQLEIEQRIAQIRAHFGSKLLILAHHYQCDQIVAQADAVGDSFALSRRAAETNAQYIVFCGVHFMAETADLVTAPDQKVFLPNVDAGCPLAEMADIGRVITAWQRIQAITGDQLIPVTYINSRLELKAFCGQNGGIVCTSSNAPRALEWAWSKKPKVFFLPDQHLGRNVALKMGIPPQEIVMYDPKRPLDDEFVRQFKQARLIIWSGFCHVHQAFSKSDIDRLRATVPGIKIIVHPECPEEVATNADFMGSTEYIIKTVTAGAPGSAWGVGTERNLVYRLARQLPDRQVILLQEKDSFCRTMAMITPIHLLYQLECLRDGRLVNQVVADDSLRANALLAVERMLELKL
ncbi:MAG TPA: quinolinate synthase NadA [Candidatus Marinimicrobia bacterium]|nr:quinolinate synthase NadA [Candidatus Neomarinimicrobiota bacterium]HRS50833.1 quinolinate synthase NadA [Candidatus Neomarinimicrobiota bacterium]HRU91826.1 quinolinate synthase NadA [Candidatus Neomarinimicrobiota bacterium]